MESGMRPSRRPLDRDRRCNFRVVGAGITGALVAERLVRDGRDLCIVDRERRGLMGGELYQSNPNRTAFNAASSTACTTRWNERSAAVARCGVRAGCSTNSSSARPGTS